MTLRLDVVLVVLVMTSADPAIFLFASRFGEKLNEEMRTISVISRVASSTRRAWSWSSCVSFSGVEEGRWKAMVKYLRSLLKVGRIDRLRMSLLHRGRGTSS